MVLCTPYSLACKFLLITNCNSSQTLRTFVLGVEAWLPALTSDFLVEIAFA